MVLDFKTLRTVKIIDLKIPGLRIISKIGEGGMSVVYLAEQVSLKREVAVKVMKLEVANNELDVQRFKHEAKTIAHLDHPNIINIYNIGQTSNGEVYFTMPYLNHGDFSNYILEDEQEFIQLLQSVCDGLAYAHDRGIVHRDIKPENLLFDKFGNVRIADFGIAISKDGTRMTKEHQIVGSAQYMSPEQARSLKVDVHTDIYSLGIVIYERLTGRVPFDSDESISILVNHVSMEPPKLSTKMRHWQPLIDKCLAKSPGHRFQSMAELKSALGKIPVNSLQRTNSSIQNALAHDIGKHLKWFAPSLLSLLLIAVYLFNKEKPSVSTNTVKVVQAVEQDQEVSPKITEQIKITAPIETSEPLVSEETIQQNEGDTNQNSGQNSENIIANSFENIAQEESLAELEQQAEPANIPISDITSDTTEAEDKEIDTESLLVMAFQNIEDYQLSKPAKNNATDQLLQVLSTQPENSKALEGIEIIGKKYFSLIGSAIRKTDFNTALKHARSLTVFNQKTNNLNSQADKQIKTLLQDIKKIDISPDSITAEQVMTLSRVAKVLAPNNEIIAELKLKAAAKTKPQKGNKLLDEMGVEVILVNNNLAAGIHEVTVELYTEFASATRRPPARCRHKGGMVNSFFNTKTWAKPYFAQTPEHPVVCVSYEDATAYVTWLSRKSGSKYRLPTKQEWLMLAAVENNTFQACKTANLTGQEAIKLRNKEDKYGCDDKFRNTAPVGSFENNNLGLYDVQGNVSEWIDCESKPCKKPTAMGSSWYSGKQSNLLDKSEKLKPTTGYSYVGFRLVRDL